MKYLLDANAIIAIFKGHAGMLERLRRHQPRDFGIPAVVIHELYFGAYKSMRPRQNISRIQALQFEGLMFSPEDARCSADVSGVKDRPGFLEAISQKMTDHHIIVTLQNPAWAYSEAQRGSGIRFAVDETSDCSKQKERDRCRTS